MSRPQTVREYGFEASRSGRNVRSTMAGIARHGALIIAFLSAILATSFPGVANAQENGAFGSVVVKVAAVRMSGRWNEILAENPGALFAATCAGDDAACAAPLLKKWKAVRERHAAGLLGRDEMLRSVNSLVNHNIRYGEDLAVRGVADQWASPADTLRRGVGDCEDFALLKMAMLLGLGVDPSAIQLVVGVHETRGQGHAVLTVRLDSENWVLDNLSERVRPDRDVTEFRPLYALAQTGAMLHAIQRHVAMANR